MHVLDVEGEAEYEGAQHDIPGTADWSCRMTKSHFFCASSFVTFLSRLCPGSPWPPTSTSFCFTGVPSCASIPASMRGSLLKKTNELPIHAICVCASWDMIAPRLDGPILKRVSIPVIFRRYSITRSAFNRVP